MDTFTLKVIQADNPWLGDQARFPEAAAHHIADPFLERDLPEIKSWPVKKKAHLIVGGRQVGKSSLLWRWFLQKNRAPLYLNAEELSIMNWCRSPALVLEDLKGLTHPGMPVFIDEAQHLQDAGLLVKGLIDGGIQNPLFVTGSSTFHLQARTKESLAGRVDRILLNPFSLKEVSSGLDGLPPIVRAQKIRDTALRQTLAGGYPEAWLSNNPERVLAHLIESFVIRDASDLFRIQHLDAFRRLLLLIAGQVGSLINASEWASICGISRGTVMDYLDLLNQTYVIHTVHPFVGGKRAEVIHRPKVYFRDNGIWNMVSRRFIPFAQRADRGPCLENWVAGELRKALSPLLPMDELRFWRSKSGTEVDFVLERPYGLVALEVKAAEMKRPAISRSARSFIHAYSPAQFIVVNLGLEHEETLDRTRIRWVCPEFFFDPPFLEI